MAIAAVDGRRYCYRRCRRRRGWRLSELALVGEFLVMFPVCWAGRVCGTVGVGVVERVYPNLIIFGSYPMSLAGTFSASPVALLCCNILISRFELLPETGLSISLYLHFNVCKWDVNEDLFIVTSAAQVGLA